MEITPPISYNNRVPRELKMFIEMTEGVFENFEDVKWSRKSDIEIGFYLINKLKKTEYFFGIWYDLWEQHGIPLSLSLRYKGKAPNEWHTRLKKYIYQNYSQGITIKSYDDWTCILFEFSYFQFDKGDDLSSLSNLYYRITEYGDDIAGN